MYDRTDRESTEDIHEPTKIPFLRKENIKFLHFSKLQVYLKTLYHSKFLKIDQITTWQFIR